MYVLLYFNSVIIPLANKARGYIRITLSVLSVHNLVSATTTKRFDLYCH